MDSTTSNVPTIYVSEEPLPPRPKRKGVRSIDELRAYRDQAEESFDNYANELQERDEKIKDLTKDRDMCADEIDEMGRKQKALTQERDELKAQVDRFKRPKVFRMKENEHKERERGSNAAHRAAMSEWRSGIEPEILIEKEWRLSSHEKVDAEEEYIRRS